MLNRMTGGHSDCGGTDWALRMLARFGFDCFGDLHRGFSDFSDPGCLQPAEFAVVSGGHSSGDAGGSLDKQLSFPIEFLLSAARPDQRHSTGRVGLQKAKDVGCATRVLPVGDHGMSGGMAIAAL